ncbi:hypothetical protein EYF80_014853 [Liparis tanakae]|uniref:Uncharacterized protein n=1 Tax=Liparis tanakae TaxID=230148 RepID=A0A4Z2IBV8_9TELE|nr:hypothetical protein EYF80_014853 [Liparis tanakae]
MCECLKQRPNGSASESTWTIIHTVTDDTVSSVSKHVVSHISPSAKALQALQRRGPSASASIQPGWSLFPPSPLALCTSSCASARQQATGNRPHPQHFTSTSRCAPHMKTNHTGRELVN